MTALAMYATDSATMLRRNLRHAVRYPMILFVAGVPVVLLLVFVSVLGGTLGAGLGDVGDGRAAYIVYVTPGILLFTVAGASQGTAISIAMDMKEGIVSRFRTMPVARASFLTGHVLSSVLQTLVALAIVAAVAVLLGFRATTGPAAWLAAAGLLALATLALTWISVGLALMTRSVETASNLPMPLMLLPFFGSGFVPTASMPDPLRWFADNQPFTPIIETVRRLLLGGELGTTALVALAWCLAITALGYVWSKRLYDRDPSG